jgi:hypothetical protein
LNVTFFCVLDDSFAPALAEREGLVSAALHLAHHENPEADEQRDGRPLQQVDGPVAAGGVRGVDHHFIAQELVGQALVAERHVRVERRDRGSAPFSLPVILFPANVTSVICLASTLVMKSVNVRDLSVCCRLEYW